MTRSPFSGKLKPHQSPISAMSQVVKAPGKKERKTRNEGFDQYIGPTDPKLDAISRERIVSARINLLMRSPFFGNIAVRLKLTNADDWLGSAATDGVHLYYNSRFIEKLAIKGEVEFLVAHEVLHLVYDHLGRCEDRHPQMFNIANDYAINADLKRHKVGEFVRSVPCLYEKKYDGKSSEEIYMDLMQNVKTINLDDLISQLLDDHMGNPEDGDGGADGDGDGEGGKKPGKGKRPSMSPEEMDRVRKEMKQVILGAAQTAEAGTLPLGVELMIKDITNPIMPWRELIQCELTSAVRNDYSWMRPSRRSWHMDAVMPGMTPGEEIDVTIAIDMSGSISQKQAQNFLGEIAGMIDTFDGYRIHVFCFDTRVYNPQDFSSENMDTIDEYVPAGGGGTDFDAIFDYLKKEAISPKRLIVFTDGYPCGSWGDPDYCDTTWIIHGDPKPNPPFGTFALYKED